MKGVSELIMQSGIINVSFADVRTMMSGMGVIMMGRASASGENRAVEAARMALAGSWFGDVNLHDAKRLLVNITAGPEMAIGEY